MENVKKQLKNAVKRLCGVEMEPDIALAPEETGADFASNVAMKLAKVAHKNPMMIAEELKVEVESVLENTGIEVAKPGFLNFRLDDAYFAEKVKEYAEDLPKALEVGDDWRGKTIVTEFSDPNPFKVLHVGHFYTSVVGDSISRLLELTGAKVVRTNFGGDVGLHVGKTLYMVLQRGMTPEQLTIDQLAECYVAGTRAYDDDEAAKAKITELNKTIYRISALGEAESTALGGEEGELAKLYWQGRKLSYEYFKDFYAQIGVEFDKFYPESTVTDKGVEEVKTHLGETYEESEGAIVYRGEKVGLHTRVFINREGVPTYETKDVGLLFTKWMDWNFAESVVITGNEQGDYMKVVLASVREYAPELVEKTRHLTHGMVRLPGNEKMSSRKGNFLKAVDVLEMVKEALSKEHGAADEKVVIAAIKYAFLKYKMGGNIVFDPEESVSMTGNSGVYLLYSAVRAQKVLEKVELRQDESVENLSNKIVQDSEKNKKEGEFERRLNKKIVQYGDVIRGAIEERAPNKVCSYLYELAQEFSRFYENVKVAGSEQEAKRKMIVGAYLEVMSHGLGLLGIEIPEAM